MTDYARRTARVLLIDATGRVLLLRSALRPGDPAAGHVWFTPGGGVGPGEDLADAAARELLEETGLVTPPAGLLRVAWTCGRADFGWASGLFRDDFFLHRVHGHQVDTTGLTAFEMRHYRGYRWWTAGELATTSEPVYPAGLATLLRDLNCGPATATPVRLPWTVSG